MLVNSFPFCQVSEGKGQNGFRRSRITWISMKRNHEQVGRKHISPGDLAKKPSIGKPKGLDLD